MRNSDNTQFKLYVTSSGCWQIYEPTCHAVSTAQQSLERFQKSDYAPRFSLTFGDTRHDPVLSRDSNLTTEERLFWKKLATLFTQGVFLTPIVIIIITVIAPKPWSNTVNLIVRIVTTAISHDLCCQWMRILAVCKETLRLICGRRIL